VTGSSWRATERRYQKYCSMVIVWYQRTDRAGSRYRPSRPQDRGRKLGCTRIRDSTNLSSVHLVLALGRTRRGDLLAAAGINWRISGEWRNRRGDTSISISLDLALYAGFSADAGECQRRSSRHHTRGLAHGRAVTVPVATVNGVVDELLEKGHIARTLFRHRDAEGGRAGKDASKLPVETRVRAAGHARRNDGPAERPECCGRRSFSK